MNQRFTIQEHVCQLVSLDKRQPPKVLKGYHIVDQTTGQPVAYAPTEALAAQAIAHYELAAKPNYLKPVN